LLNVAASAPAATDRRAARRSREDLGDAEAAADLDELAARHDDDADRRERGEHEEHRCDFVVDDEGEPGAGEGFRETLAGS
jgi:hypothetical protein